MTDDTPPKPKRRRWRWVCVALVAMSLAGGAVPVWDNRVEQRAQAWLAEASKRKLLIAYDTVGIIPGIEHVFGKQLLGRRQITVGVFGMQDAQNLKMMPPCPVRLVINVCGSPWDVVEWLRLHFGNAIE
ncbi:hypothetical protein Pan44_29470 [Caulifigura coniformis]|uniref:Uncharacterized protein n=2 Tax=Caulifigura coniformis TaxID=2527983 RepID=A0A517SFL2_9PLAN|nr:hypothetical protein Pan44_29470 [Caulifigura coniformis]